MCYPVRCPKCGKTGWGGCGRHVDVVMSSVPAADRCTCQANPAAPPAAAGNRRRLRSRTSRRD